MATRIYTAGQLDQRVQFQQRAAGESDLNERTGPWQDVGDPVWAAVLPIRGAEALAAGGQQQTMDTLIVVRHTSARPAASIQSEELRVVWRGQPFDVVAAVPVDGGLEWIEIQALKGARDGRQF